MITKINPYKPNTIRIDKSKAFCSRLTFKGKDKFMRTTSAKPISEAVSYMLDSISSTNFVEARVLFSNPDKQILLQDLMLKAEKVKHKINVSVTYDHPNVSGSVPLASGSAEEVKKVISDNDFTKNLIKKLRDASDDALFGKTERFED